MENNRFFPEIHGNLGFGCMRLPMQGDEIDLAQVCKMADAFVAAGFNYFDTAHGYHSGKSETAVRECVAKRFDRSQFLLANKLTAPYFETQADIRPFVEQQLALCGVEYFDFYLMHAQDRDCYEKFQACRAYETCFSLKDAGLIRHFGLSFHDKAEVLDRILSDHPEVEFVQIQFNYADYEDASVESRLVYEVCEKHDKPVIVMEPVKGGNLVKLPAEADNLLRALGTGCSNAGYALRYAASFPRVAVVLSGMSDLSQMEDNLSTMRDFKPLDEAEQAAIKRVCEIFRAQKLVPCTGCRYCIEANACPMDILIPDQFAALNTYSALHGWNTIQYYKGVLTDGHGKASDCVQCGSCEDVCPQHLEIRSLLEKVAETFEKK